MRIHLLSDLHLEFAPFDAPVTDADLVILVGDIAQGIEGIVWAKQQFKVPAIYVAGNHEYYGDHDGPTIGEVHAALRLEAQGSNVHFLENESYSVGKVRFLCATLWTDFKIYGDAKRGMVSARMGLTDFNGAIKTNDGFFRPSDALAIHENSVAWLQNELAQTWDGVTVVVTHFLPSAKSVAKRWVGDPANTGFASELDHLIEKANFWFHGHTHDSCDYQLGQCRVVCNPRGYSSRKKSLSPENMQFNPSLVIHV